MGGEGEGLSIALRAIDEECVPWHGWRPREVCCWNSWWIADVPRSRNRGRSGGAWREGRDGVYSHSFPLRAINRLCEEPPACASWVCLVGCWVRDGKRYESRRDEMWTMNIVGSGSGGGGGGGPALVAAERDGRGERDGGQEGIKGGKTRRGNIEKK